MNELLVPIPTPVTTNQTLGERSLRTFLQDFHRDGFCLLPGLFPRDVLENWRAHFTPLLDEHMKHYSDPSFRGANRFYVTLPFVAPFADPQIFENEIVLEFIEQVAGKDFVMCQLATDSPTFGSDYQPIHGDARPLFPTSAQSPHSPIIPPPFQLAVNFPLVDVNKENGPLEITRGTHLMSKEEGLRRIESGEIKIEALEMKVGDVLIRDVRGLHRGTPNRTGVPRPMVVIGYSPSWFRRPEVSIQIPRAQFEQLSPRAKHMLRFEPITERGSAEVRPETYKAFAY